MIRWITRLRSEFFYRWKTRNGLPWNAGYLMTIRYKDEAFKRDMDFLHKMAIETIKGASVMKELIPRFTYIDRDGELIEEDDEEYDTHRD